MAIIPKGSFQRRVSTERRTAQLSTDGAAKPYRALAELGGTFAEVASTLFDKSQQDADIAEINKRRDEYAVESTGLVNKLKNSIDDDGNVSSPEARDPIAYSQAYTEENDRLIKRISGSIKRESARTKFQQSIARSSRKGQVDSITFEESHKTQRYSVNAKKTSLSSAQGFILKSENVNSEALSSHRARVL